MFTLFTSRSYKVSFLKTQSNGEPNYDLYHQIPTQLARPTGEIAAVHAKEMLYLFAIRKC